MRIHQRKIGTRRPAVFNPRFNTAGPAHPMVRPHWVIYQESDEAVAPVVLGVKEFQVAKVLLEHGKELLSELVPSQWGPVHLFDLCLWFGHVDTALTLAHHGLKGCKVEDYHLGVLPVAMAPPEHFPCDCKGWQTCNRCCWGFPVDIGVWMKDWDAPLRHAAEAARLAAKIPVVDSILEIIRCQWLVVSSSSEIISWHSVIPFALSDKAAAKLLDIAILSGNRQAAINLAPLCSLFPLRRWRAAEPESAELQPICSAALGVGADLSVLGFSPQAAPPKRRPRQLPSFSSPWLGKWNRCPRQQKFYPNFFHEDIDKFQ